MISFKITGFMTTERRPKNFSIRRQNGHRRPGDAGKIWFAWAQKDLKSIRFMGLEQIFANTSAFANVYEASSEINNRKKKIAII